MSVATLTVLALRASIEQVGTHLLCLLSFLSSYLSNTKTFTLATFQAKKKRYKLYLFIAFSYPYLVVLGALCFTTILVSGMTGQ